VGYEISKEINLPQLLHEIEGATGQSPVNAATTVDADGNTILWLTPAGLDAAVIAATVTNHVPDPMWGIPAVTQAFNEALSRLRENPDGPLIDADRDALVKGIALNFTALMPSQGT
jgi:hypothetical protein